jgi:hypothetical protein
MSSPRTGSASGAPGGQLQDAMLKFSDEVFEAMQRLLRAQRELSQTMLGGGNGLLAERTEDVAGGGGDRSQPGGAEQQDESSDVTGAAGIDEDVALQEPGQDVMEPDETRSDEAEDLVAEPDDSTDEDEALTDEAEDTTDEDEDLTDEYDDDLDEDSDDYRDSDDNYSQSDVYAPDTGARRGRARRRASGALCSEGASAGQRTPSQRLRPPRTASLRGWNGWRTVLTQQRRAAARGGAR